MNSFNFTLSGKHFISLSILNDSFAGYSNLGCRSLPFMTSNTYFQPFLACKFSFEKSADSLMANPLQVTLSFPLAAFKILSFSLTLGHVIMMFLAVFLFGSNFFGTLWASLTSWKSIFFSRLGKFPLLFFQISFQLLALPLTFRHPHDSDVRMFKVVPEVPKPLPIFFFFEFLCTFCSVECLFLPSVPNH